MPPHRTFSGLTRDFNRLTKQNGQLQHQRDEALKAAQEVKTKNKRLKKALQKEKQQQAESPTDKLIPRPDGQAGRKMTINRNGCTRQGFNLRTEMGLDGANDKMTYNDFREFVWQAVPGDRYQKFEDMGPVVVGVISSKSLKKFPFLSTFQGHWPIKVVLQSYFTNRKNYKKGGKKRQRGDGLDDESDNDRGGAAEGGEGSDDDDSVPGGVDAMRHGEGQGGGVTDEEEDEPVVKTVKRKAIAIDDSGEDRPYTSRRRKPNPRIRSFDSQDTITEVPMATTEDEDEAADLAEWYHHQRKAGSGGNQYSTRYRLLSFLSAVEKHLQAPQSQIAVNRRSTRKK